MESLDQNLILNIRSNYNFPLPQQIWLKLNLSPFKFACIDLGDSNRMGYNLICTTQLWTSALRIQ